MIELKTDSRKVKPGDTFIAIKNVNTDGHNFIESAIKNGATKIICEKGSYSVETVVVPNTKEYLNNYLYENYYPKIKDMKLIGVTGTNGKTTICYLVYQLLTLLGKKCAYIGTIGFYYGNTKRLLNNTTPDTDLLYDMLLEAKEYGCEYVVMEVSSHALDKNRVFGLEFDEVAFTNLTQDHLDYHKTLEKFLQKNNIKYHIVAPLRAAKSRQNDIRSIKTDKRDCLSFAGMFYDIKNDSLGKFDFESEFMNL